MSGLRQPDDERIRVGVPRARRSRRLPRRGVEDNSGAGLTGLAILVIAVFAFGFAGRLLGATIAGAIIGLVIGAPASFAAVYARWGRS